MVIGENSGGNVAAAPQNEALLSAFLSRPDDPLFAVPHFKDGFVYYYGRSAALRFAGHSEIPMAMQTSLHVERVAQMVATVDRVIAAATATNWVTVPAVSPEVNAVRRCRDCRGGGHEMVPCPACAGNCRKCCAECGSEVKCTECDGRGDRVSETGPTCVRCGGVCCEFHPVFVCNVYLAGHYASLMQRLEMTEMQSVTTGTTGFSPDAVVFQNAALGAFGVVMGLEPGTIRGVDKAVADRQGAAWSPKEKAAS